MINIASLEKERQKCRKLVIGGTALLILSVVLIFLTVSFLSEVLVALFIMMAIAGGIIMGVGHNNFSKVVRKFKDYYMIQVINELIPGANYQEHLGIPLNDVYKSGLLKRADRAHSEDLITGKSHDVNFRTCDLKLEERRVHTDSKGHRHVTYVPYFIGRYFIFDFNKNFKGNIIVTEASLPFGINGLKKISLESEEFNNKFRTYSSDELSAFYVLTPQFMEAIMELEQQNPGCLMFYINSNQLHLAINNNRDTFSLKINRPIDESLVNGFKREMSVINRIIYEMNLNNKIFKEEY